MGNCLGSCIKEPSSSSIISRNQTPETSGAYNSSHTMDFSATSGSTGNRSQFSQIVSEDGGGGIEEEGDLIGQLLETPDLKEFSFSELKAATKNFKPDTLLGEGFFGKVYKGWIDHDKTFSPSKSGTGTVVAVKKLNSESVHGFQEWQYYH